MKSETQSIQCNPCTSHNLETPARRLNSNQILNAVSEFFQMSPSLICGKLRYRHIVEARHLAMYMMRKDRYLHLSLKHIGNIMGNRDHATVMHAVESVSNLIEVDEVFREKAKELFLKTYGNLHYMF